jgi:hypothetical protein
LLQPELERLQEARQTLPVRLGSPLQGAGQTRLALGLPPEQRGLHRILLWVVQRLLQREEHRSLASRLQQEEEHQTQQPGQPEVGQILQAPQLLVLGELQIQLWEPRQQAPLELDRTLRPQQERGMETRRRQEVQWQQELEQPQPVDQSRILRRLVPRVLLQLAVARRSPLELLVLEAQPEQQSQNSLIPIPPLGPSFETHQNPVLLC